MYSKEQIYKQATSDPRAIVTMTVNGKSAINNGVKIHKFPSKIEIINLSRGGDYFQECTQHEYNYFYRYGWSEGAIRLCMSNTKRKLEMIEEKVREEVNTRKNNKHIQSMKARRENLLIKYAERNKQLNQITNGKQNKQRL